MNDESAFLNVIKLATPGDPLPRLVYADWLEERGDSRSEYLRLLAVADNLSSPDREKVLDRLQVLRGTLDVDWAEAVQQGLGWRTRFEVNLQPQSKRRDEIYEIGPPATEQQIAAAEQSLGFALPADARAMVQAFNGSRVWYCYGPEEDQRAITARLNSLEEMVAEPAAIRGMYGEEFYVESGLGRAIFIEIGDGNHTLLCVEAIGEFAAGEVICLDHDGLNLTKQYESLQDFVTRYNRSSLYR